MPVARLVGVTAELSFPLDKPIVLIGRHPDCDAVIQDSGKVSRRHCCVAHADDRFVIRDLGSMNGIRVNGVAVPFADLNPGDEVSVGDVQFLFERGNSAARAKSNGVSQVSSSAASSSAKVARLPESSASSGRGAGSPELKETPPREMPQGSLPGASRPAGKIAVQAAPQLVKRERSLSEQSTLRGPVETVNDPDGINGLAPSAPLPQSIHQPEQQTLNISGEEPGQYADETFVPEPSSEQPLIVFADAAAAFDKDVRSVQNPDVDLDDAAAPLADVSMEMPVAIDEDSSQGFDVMEVIIEDDDAIQIQQNPPQSSDHSPPQTTPPALPKLGLPPIPKRS